MKSLLRAFPILSPARCTLLLLFAGGISVNLHAAASNSIARVWNERALAAIATEKLK